MSMMMAYMRSADALPYECPSCGLGLYPDDELYVSDGHIEGCMCCFYEGDLEDRDFRIVKAEDVL